MKTQHLLTTMVAFSLLSGAALAQQQTANRMETSSGDKTFVTKAAQGGMAEVELGNLAQQNASNDKVKEFGKRMVEDHSKANDELKTIASGKGMQVPSSIDSKSQVTKTRLEGLHGAEFDKTYMQDMVKDHKEDIAEFQKEANHGSDPDIKAFAAKTLPTLQEHLKMAQDALSAVSSGSGK